MSDDIKNNQVNAILITNNAHFYACTFLGSTSYEPKSYTYASFEKYYPGDYGVVDVSGVKKLVTIVKEVSIKETRSDFRYRLLQYRVPKVDVQKTALYERGLYDACAPELSKDPVTVVNTLPRETTARVTDILSKLNTIQDKGKP